MAPALFEAILEIVKLVPNQTYFDTHVIIEKLLDHHAELYRDFVADKDLNNAHAEISCVVRDSGLVTRARHQSYSRTIHGSYDSIACWLRND